jgi:hypothetical protein
MGDVGGVMSVLTVLISFLIQPFADFSFKLKAFKRLYLVNTTDYTLMKNPSLLKKKNKHLFNRSVHSHISPKSQSEL